MSQFRTVYIVFPLLWGVFFFAFFPVFNGLWTSWSRSDEYSHGFFVIPIALYICWQKKEFLGQISTTYSWIGLLLFVFSLFLYIGSKYAGVATVSSLAMIFCLVGLVLFLYGWKVLKELGFPLFFLAFMIPIPGQIYSSLTQPLQLIVSQISVTLASLAGIPILREGNVIHLPDQTLEVVQACSGLRSLVTLLTLSAAMGYFSLRKKMSRFALFVSAVPIAIIVNIVRVFIMIITLYYFQYDLMTDSVHQIYGLAIFFLALAAIFGFQKVLLVWDAPIDTK